MLQCERRAAFTAEPCPSQGAPCHFKGWEPSASPSNSCHASFNDLRAKLERRKEMEVCWSVSRAKAVSVTSFHLFAMRWARSEMHPFPRISSLAGVCFYIYTSCRGSALQSSSCPSPRLPRCPWFAPAQPLQVSK